MYILASRIYKAAVIRALNGEDELITPREREMLAVSFNRGFTSGYLLTDQVMQREYPDSRGLPLGTAVSEGRTVMVAAELGEGDGITFYRQGVKMRRFRGPLAPEGGPVDDTILTIPPGDRRVRGVQDQGPGVRRH